MNRCSSLVGRIEDLSRNCVNTNGFVESPAGELFFERRGALEGTPLICVHGGPGFTSHYLEPLFDLGNSRPIICYDQAGCGRSRERSPIRKDLSIEAFVAELEALRRACGSERVFLLGHSFGGLIIGEYALRHPQHVAGVIFACVSIDIPRWIDDGQRLVSGLPLMSRMVLREALRTGEFSSPQFVSALMAYYRKHVYGFDEKPESILRSEAESDARTYQIVWGPSELAVTGTIKDYSLSPRLSQLTSPALFICGRYDEATPEAHQYFSSLVQGSACHICEQSAHHPQITEREEFLGVVRNFLRSLDNA
jgi:proline iminopeptidase